MADRPLDPSPPALRSRWPVVPAGALALALLAATAPGDDETLAQPPEAPLVYGAETDGNLDLWLLAEGVRERLTRHAAQDHAGAVSPDGRWLAFQTHRSAPYDLFITDLDGAHEARPLVAGPRHAGLPVWSPDGARIAFFSDHELPEPEAGARPGHVYVIDWEEQPPRPSRVTRAPLEGPLGPTHWSPNGRWLTVSRRRPGTGLDVFALDVESGDERVLAAGPDDEYGARLSPDGSLLACYLETEDRCAVGLVELDTGARRTLTDAPGWHYVQCWSPDGAWLAVLSYSADFSSSRPWALRVADGTRVELDLPPGARDLCWVGP